ncbi:MAG: prepilin-type N-terminal cleavage/methylation domain-containing protein [Chitinispirillales bacterium]|jgi:prepilin-type N-terminal cleavage/methylation domain-containing protein|nr:prepilin-type N-terminal cleavage/methylation domain-containing protein [Chitinispirillales bacterium]
MQKYLRNNKGFTLVEVIVVAVIVLILAAVAIPLYNGYIKDSRVSVASSTAGTIASALGAAVQSNLISGATLTATIRDDMVVVPTASGDSTTILLPRDYGAILVGTTRIAVWSTKDHTATDTVVFSR